MLFLQILILLALIVLNGFFAMSELAVVSSRRNRLQQMADEGGRGAARALKLQEDPTGFLSTVQIGITLIGIFAGAYSGANFSRPLASLLHPLIGSEQTALAVSFVLVVVATTYLSLVVGELMPKQLALNHSERIASAVAGPMTMIARISMPVVWVLRLSTNMLLRIVGVGGLPVSRVTEEDIRALILEGAQTGVVKPAEHEMLEAVMTIADRPVRSIMVPRPDVVCLRAGDPRDQWRRIIRETGHSRYPLCGESTDDVLGIIHVKDLFDDEAASPRSLAREPLFVAEQMPIIRLLDALKASPVKMAIVLDEFGGLEGIVTPSDILIAIAGDFPDAGGDALPDAVRRADGSWLLEGSMSVDAAIRQLEDFDVEGERDYVTVAGFVLEKLGHIPEPGDGFDHGAWHFEVVDLDQRRIDKVIASRR